MKRKILAMGGVLAIVAASGAADTEFLFDDFVKLL